MNGVTRLDRFLFLAAARCPNAPALIDVKSTVSYGELDELATRVAAVLLDRGVARGDRVAIAIETSIDMAAAYFGAMRAGAVAVPLPADPHKGNVSRAIQDCAPAACVIDERIAQDTIAATGMTFKSVLVRRRGKGAPVLGPPNAEYLDAALSSASSRLTLPPVIDRDLAAIIYTSGSTGAPRGVMLTHRNLVENTRSIVSALGLTAADRVMCVLPFYYVYGLSLLHTHIAVGGSVVIDNRFAFPNVVLEAMQEHAVTGLAGVPSTFALLLHRSRLAEMRFPSLRYVTQAGGPMPPARISEWLEKGPPVPFFVMYGATEAAARLTVLPPADLRRKLGSIGRPIPNVEVNVITDEGRPAAPGEVGELVARGSNISIGYWNNAAESGAKFSGDGYRTGDLGFKDDEGFLFLVGRRQDMLKVGGHRVAVKEIEDVLHEHPFVHEAAVVGLDHVLLGEVPVAVVTPHDMEGFDVEAVVRHCQSKLPLHKVPFRVISSQSLPKSGAGKIDRAAVRELVYAACGTGIDPVGGDRA